jgi:hypothetical protein
VPAAIGLAGCCLALGASASPGAASTRPAAAVARPAAARPAAAVACPSMLAPALAADPKPHALRVFAIQFRQQPATISSGAAFARAIDCVMRTEVAPYLARGRPNLVVFDEDIGLEAIAAGPRGAAARSLLAHGVKCGGSPCETLAALAAIDSGYGRALNYLEPRFLGLSTQLGRGFVAATDTFVRVFMTTMASEARRYGVYVVASSTQAPFALTRNAAAVAALRDPSRPAVGAVYAPTAGRAYNQVFLWGPRVIHAHAPTPLANLLSANRKVPLTAFEQVLGFAAGPSGGSAAIANLRPVRIPGTAVRLGFATSLPAFVYGAPARGHECDDVTVSYMRCLDRLGANVLIQTEANDGQWTGPDGSNTLEQWQPLTWMASSWRAVSDPSVHFRYAVNPFMVGNLADTPFDGQSAILQRGLRGPGCHYIGNGSFVTDEDDPALAAYTGSKPQFLALAPWVVPDAGRAALRPLGAALAAGTAARHYVQTALIADLPFPADSRRRGCVIAGVGHH